MYFIVMFTYSYCMFIYFIVVYDLLCVFCFTVLYSVSFCCFVYCSCVTVHRTTDTVFQPNCSSQIYIYQNYKEYFLGYE